MPKEYNGHRSWNGWNVALHLSNDEGLYFLAVDCYRRSNSPRQALKRFITRSGLLGTRTPDGAIYNRLSIYLGLQALEFECGGTA